MTILTRWDPYRELNTLQDRMNRLFNASFTEGRDESLATSSFAPAVDVYEDEHNVTLKFEVPGIDEKDVDVRIENSILTVHGEDVVLDADIDVLLVNPRNFDLQRNVVLVFVHVYGWSEARSGQSFIPAQLDKIRNIRRMIGARPVHLEVDGGINAKTVTSVVEAGADVIVAGSGIFKDGNYRDNIAAIRRHAERARTAV